MDFKNISLNYVAFQLDNEMQKMTILDEGVVDVKKSRKIEKIHGEDDMIV